MESRATRIQPDGTAERVPLDQAEPPADGAGLVWLHIDANDKACVAWLQERSGIPHPVVKALTALETRPRALPLETGALVNLRGAGTDCESADDLVSVRLWSEAGRVVSVAFRRLPALDELCGAVQAKRVKDPGDLIYVLAEMLTLGIDPLVFDLSDDLDGLEERVVEGKAPNVAEIREQIGRARLSAVQLRRYIAPQRDALMRLAGDDFPFFEDADRVHLGEAANRVTRMIEDLDSVRERAIVLSEQLTDLRGELIGQRTLVLSVVSSIFLPLTVLTGLLGMNVNGIPFHDSPYAFAFVCGLCVAIGLALWGLMKKTGWF